MKRWKMGVLGPAVLSAACAAVMEVIDAVYAESEITFEAHVPIRAISMHIGDKRQLYLLDVSAIVNPTK